MAYPSTYNRQTSFALFSSQYPTRQQDGADLDAEYNAVKTSIDETQASLKLIQDAEGRLAPGSVGRRQLDSSITIGFESPTAWAAATVYMADTSTVFKDAKFYSCLIDHTSGTFADDLGAGYWLEVADLSASAAIEDSSITTAKLADSAVTSAKIQALAVSTSKLATGAVTTEKVGAGAVTADKVAQSVWDVVWSTGDVKLTLKTVADPGWVLFDDGAIGDASSGASTRANADTEALFTLLWTNFSNALAPVSGGRGASAAADFAAHKTIGLIKTLGRALAVAGSGSGLTARTLGSNAGAETHALSESELAAHDHDVFLNDPGHAHGFTYNGADTGGTGFGRLINIQTSGGGANVTTTSVQTGVQVRSASGGGGTQNSTAEAGSGTAHNNMQPSTFLNAMVKL